MDVVVPSICLSSVAGAILFYTGGRLQARPAPPPPPRPDVEVETERAARKRAEEESAGAQRATRDAVAALAEERNRTTGLRDALAAARGGLARAEADAVKARGELEQARADATKARAEVAQARGDAAQARAEAAKARAEVTKARTEAEALRKKVRDLTETPAPARRTSTAAWDGAMMIPEPEARTMTSRGVPIPDPPYPRTATGDTESAIAVALQDLCRGEPGCRAAVISDTRGLLVASSGKDGHRLELAAAAALTLSTSERLRELLPLGEPAAFTFVDANDVVFRTRWLPVIGDERLLLSTLGTALGGADVAAQALHRRLDALLGRSG